MDKKNQSSEDFWDTMSRLGQEELIRKNTKAFWDEVFEEHAKSKEIQRNSFITDDRKWIYGTDFEVDLRSLEQKELEDKIEAINKYLAEERKKKEKEDFIEHMPDPQFPINLGVGIVGIIVYGIAMVAFIIYVLISVGVDILFILDLIFIGPIMAIYFGLKAKNKFCQEKEIYKLSKTDMLSAKRLQYKELEKSGRLRAEAELVRKNENDQKRQEKFQGNKMRDVFNDNPGLYYFYTLKKHMPEGGWLKASKIEILIVKFCRESCKNPENWKKAVELLEEVGILLPEEYRVLR